MCKININGTITVIKFGINKGKEKISIISICKKFVIVKCNL